MNNNFMHDLARRAIVVDSKINLKHTGTLQDVMTTLLVHKDTLSMQMTNVNPYYPTIEVYTSNTIDGTSDIIRVEDSNPLYQNSWAKSLKELGFSSGNKRNLRDKLLYGLVDHFFKMRIYELTIQKGEEKDIVTMSTCTGKQIEVALKYKNGAVDNDIILVRTVMDNGQRILRNRYTDVEPYLNYIQTVY